MLPTLWQARAHQQGGLAGRHSRRCVSRCMSTHRRLVCRHACRHAFVECIDLCAGVCVCIEARMEPWVQTCVPGMSESMHVDKLVSDRRMYSGCDITDGESNGAASCRPGADRAQLCGLLIRGPIKDDRSQHRYNVQVDHRTSAWCNVRQPNPEDSICRDGYNMP